MENLTKSADYAVEKTDHYFFQVRLRAMKAKTRYIYSPASASTPEVKLDLEKGYLKLSGRSNCENPLQFYGLLFDHLERVLLRKTSNIYVGIALEYFNTSSAKCLYELFRRLNSNAVHGISTTVIWYYEKDDEDMLESGKDYEDRVPCLF